MRGLLRAAPQATHGENKNSPEKGRKQLDMMESLRAEPRLEVPMEDRIGDDDLADDPSEQRRAGPDQDRGAVQQRHDQSRTSHDQRYADGEADHEQGNVALGSRSDGDHVVEAHDDV